MRWFNSLALPARKHSPNPFFDVKTQCFLGFSTGWANVYTVPVLAVPCALENDSPSSVPALSMDECSYYNVGSR